MKYQQTAIALAILGLTGISVPASAAGDSSTSSASTMRSGHAQTRQVQQALKDKGYDPGPVDGVMGSRTREALKQYQKSQNLTDSAGLDSKTLDSLGVRAAATTSTMPTAGGDSAEPQKSGRPAPAGAARSSSPATGSSAPNPTAGGNSSEPDKSGRPAPSGASKGGTGSSTPNPTAGGNSAEPDKSGKAK